ncbi:MAG: tRNA isopentenyl-2-thiomethyl-A-37 hydroxylase MiaE [Polyangiaceae bacterium]
MLCLRVPTDESWAREAVREIGSVLVDHAHCELKAASNAVSLAGRDMANHALVRTLSELAREEMEHFEAVLTLVEARGLTLGNPPVDTYAAELRKVAHKTPRPHDLDPLVDRLIVAAIIEARSCERFKRMIEALEDSPHGDVLTLYRELFPAEARHYRTYVELAELAAGRHANLVAPRLEALALAEASIVTDIARGELRATIHG